MFFNPLAQKIFVIAVTVQEAPEQPPAAETVPGSPPRHEVTETKNPIRAVVIAA